MSGDKTFLAWENLTHSWRRLALAVFGVGFAVLLMTMQVGFRNAMLDSTAAAIAYMNADLIITSASRYTMQVSEQFSRRRLMQAQATPGVAATYPLYIETKLGVLRNPHSGVAYPVRTFAFNPDEPVLLLPEVVAQQAKLKVAGTALFDEKSKSDYGPIATGSRTDLGKEPITVVGLFALGTDFANDGNVVTSDETLRAAYRGPGVEDAQLNAVDVGLVRVARGYRPQAVKQRLLETLPDDVKVLTRREFANQEKAFWNSSTPVGFIFGLGTAMGFLVGVIFCYQILYTDIADHLSEFATLKAMGYPNRYFISVVVQEALLLSLFGFVPGVLASAVLYFALGEMTGLLLRLTLLRALLILSLTIVMCIVSAALAVRKVLSADPVELFK